MSITVGELIDALEDLDHDLEVHLATQPTYPLEYPLEYAIDNMGPVLVTVPTEEDPQSFVYLFEGGQIGYLPRVVREEMGW